MGDTTQLEADFNIEWEDPSKMQLRTACCCCFCAFDDCQEFIKVQAEVICLWLELRDKCQCCQCTNEDDNHQACCDGDTTMKCLSMRNEEGNLVCVKLMENGYFCCCSKAIVSYACCDPCGAPESCIKGQTQVFCVHQRCALPTDEDVPFEIACCGASLYGGPTAQE